MHSARNSPEKIRHRHNVDLLRRVRSGEVVAEIDTVTNRFPPRPLIQKDQRELHRLYGLELNSHLIRGR